MDSPRGIKREHEDGDVQFLQAARVKRRIDIVPERPQSLNNVFTFDSDSEDGFELLRPSPRGPERMIYVFDGHEAQDVEEKSWTFRPAGQERRVRVKTYRVEDRQRDWLDTLHVQCTHNGRRIGTARGKFIRRELIRDKFWEKLDSQSSELANIALDVFDQNGFLRPHWKDHRLRQGTGTWQWELDFGCLFFVEEVHVTDQRWRRMKVGRAMVNILMKKAHALNESLLPDEQQKREMESSHPPADMSDIRKRWYLHVIAKPGWLKEDAAPQWMNKSSQMRQAINAKALQTAIAFFQLINFRRIGASTCFGYSFNSRHLSRKIPAAEDWDIPPAPSDDFNDEESRISLFKQKCPLLHATVYMTDVDCVEFYKTFPANEGAWNQVDTSHNTILHVAASRFKSQSLKWLLDNVPETERWRFSRNLEGCTPLEVLQAAMENWRTFRRAHGMIMDVSHDFNGFPLPAISCLSLLSGEWEKDPSPAHKLRLKYGCTCGECVGGIMSARMRLSLGHYSKATHYRMKEDMYGSAFCQLYASEMKHLPPGIKLKFRTEPDLREGFTSIFDRILWSLNLNRLPKPNNIMDSSYITDDEYETREAARTTQVYLSSAGVANGCHAALKAVFDQAKAGDEKVGNGDFFRCNRNRLAQVKACRNDHDFDLVAWACAELELVEYKVEFEDSTRDPIVHKISTEEEKKALEKEIYPLYESSHYEQVVTFNVKNDIISGLKYQNSVFRNGVRVAKDTQMLGSFGPKTEPHSITLPRHGWEEVVSGGVYCDGKID